jgi:hypothetical protein
VSVNSTSTPPGLLEFVTDPQLLGLVVSPAQRTLLKALDGQGLDREEHELWRLCTGRPTYRAVKFLEATVICGARSGKDSRVAAPLVCYEAVFGDHERHLARGETGTIVLVAQDQKATQTAFGYIRDYMLHSPLLRALVEEPRESELRLTNRIHIACFASTAKSIRGWSIPAAVMDELAFFRLSTGADADVEIQTAIRRGGAGFPAPRLIKITTPYLRTGVAYEDFQRYFGQDEADDVLVWRAPTTLMNPTINEKRLAREQRVDAQRFAREYLAEFGEDVEAFLPGVWVEQATAEDRHELAPRAGVRYLATVDPSGGAVKGDAFALSVIHLEGARFVQDVMKAWTSGRAQTVDLGSVCREIAEILGRYDGLARVTGDHYAGNWPAQAFRDVGISYTPSEFDKSKAYRELEPMLAQGRVELLDHPTMLRELRLLERRYKPGGRTPTIDHPKGGHDDCANALALGVAELAKSLAPAIGGTYESFQAARVARGEAPRVDAAPADADAGGDGYGFFGHRPAPRYRQELSDDERFAQVVAAHTGRRTGRGWLRMFR